MGAWAGSIFGVAAGVASAACASPQMACLILSKIPILNVPLMAFEHMLTKQDGAEGRAVQTGLAIFRQYSHRLHRTCRFTEEAREGGASG
jgi:hypothetical protein